MSIRTHWKILVVVIHKAFFKGQNHHQKWRKVRNGFQMDTIEEKGTISVHFFQ
jgi:hypothetical protein